MTLSHKRSRTPGSCHRPTIKRRKVDSALPGPSLIHNEQASPPVAETGIATPLGVRYNPFYQETSQEWDAFQDDTGMRNLDEFFENEVPDLNGLWGDWMSPKMFNMQPQSTLLYDRLSSPFRHWADSLLLLESSVGIGPNHFGHSVYSDDPVLLSPMTSSSLLTPPSAETISSINTVSDGAAVSNTWRSATRGYVVCVAPNALPFSSAL